MSLMRKNYRSASSPSIWDEFFRSSEFDENDSSRTGTTVPSVNIRETKDDFILEVAAPGMKKEDFNIELNNKLLTVSSEKEEGYEDEEKKGKYSRREFSYQSFQRSFTLPDSTDGEKISAKYSDGILRITIPKKEESKEKPPRNINIS